MFASLLVVIAVGTVSVFAGDDRVLAEKRPDSACHRALAWVRVLDIRERSVPAMEWRDTVTVHSERRGDLRFAEYEVRADEHRGVRVRGAYWTGVDVPGGAWRQQRTDLYFSLKAGVMRVVGQDGFSGSTRPEASDVVWPWCVPSPQVGLGRMLQVMHLHSRAEYLARCEDLRIESEDRLRVVVGGTLREGKLPQRYRVTIDAATGDVVKEELVNLTWDIVTLEREMPVWAEFDGVRVPVVTEYRLFQIDLDQDAVAEIDALLAAEDLSPGMRHPQHPGFKKWCRFRDGHFGPRGAPRRLAADWQSCRTDRVRLIWEVPRDWVDLPAELPLERFFSRALECTVDQFDQEPSNVAPEQPGGRGGDVQ